MSNAASPPSWGHSASFDYKAIEPRLCAYFAAKVGYPEFAEAIRAGADPYTAVARLVTGKPEVTDEERQNWKRTYLSLLYGGGVRTIQAQYGNTVRQARHIIDTFHENWPAVRALQDMTKAVVLKRGYMVSLGGRHLHLEDYGEHKLLNKLIQGSAADVLKVGLNAVDDWQEAHPTVRSHMVSQVHDEIIFDGPRDELELLHEIVPRLMARGFPQVSEIVPIVVDHEVALTSWADKREYEEVLNG